MILTAPEVALMLKVSIVTLKRWRREQTGPPSYYLNGRVRYREVDVRDWMNSHLVPGGAR